MNLTEHAAAALTDLATALEGMDVAVTGDAVEALAALGAGQATALATAPTIRLQGGPSYEIETEVWVITPCKDPTEALQQLSPLVERLLTAIYSDAAPDTFTIPSGVSFPGYRLTITNTYTTY